MQTDVRHNLRPQLDNFDAIVVDIQFNGPIFNLGLQRVIQRINQGGILILASLERVDSLDGFEMLNNDQSYPHIFEIHQNNYQYNNSFVSVWKRTTPKQQAQIAEEGSPLKVQHETFYDQTSTFNDYKKFHYDDKDNFGVPNYARAMGEYCIQTCKKHNIPLETAIDCASGPGAIALKLAQEF